MEAITLYALVSFIADIDLNEDENVSNYDEDDFNSIIEAQIILNIFMHKLVCNGWVASYVRKNIILFQIALNSESKSSNVRVHCQSIFKYYKGFSFSS